MVSGCIAGRNECAVDGTGPDDGPQRAAEPSEQRARSFWRLPLPKFTLGKHRWWKGVACSHGRCVGRVGKQWRTRTGWVASLMSHSTQRMRRILIIQIICERSIFQVTESIGVGIGISFIGRRRIAMAQQLKTRDQRHPSQICTTERFHPDGTQDDSYQCQEKPPVRNGMDWLQCILAVFIAVLFRDSPQTYSCFRSNARWQIFRCFNSFLCKSGHRQIRA